MPTSPNPRSYNAERRCDGKRNYADPQVQRTSLKPQTSTTITFNARKCPTIGIVLGQLPVERDRQDPNGPCDNKSNSKSRRLTHKSSTKTIINAKHPTLRFSGRATTARSGKLSTRGTLIPLRCKRLCGNLIFALNQAARILPSGYVTKPDIMR